MAAPFHPRTKRGWKLKNPFSKGGGQKQIMPTTDHKSTPSEASKSNFSNVSQHEQKHVNPTAPPGARSALLVGPDLGSLSYNSPMDRANTKHREVCKRGTSCPCRVLDIDCIDDELFAIEVSSEASKPWIRKRLQILLPSLKALEPWLEIVDAIAQVNPISGQVSGLVKVALKMAIIIGDQYDDMVSSIQYVKEILYLLALYEKDGPPSDLVDDIIQAYINIFDFLCAESAHKHARKEAEDRLANSVQRLESRATPTILNLITNWTKVQTLAEMERKGDECVKQMHDTGTPNEESVDLRYPAKKTCDWVYDCPESDELQPWRDWRDSKDSGIMLLTGGIGTGKSTLALNAIDALRNYPSSQCRLVSASFCKDQAVYNRCEAILRGLLYGIARGDRAARDVLVRHRDKSNQADVGTNYNAFTRFDKLSSCFTECVQIRKKELCLVVDGLDECESKSRQTLLEYFKTLVEGAQSASLSPPLKFLFLSRPVTEIITMLPASKKLDLHKVRKPDETKRIIEHLVKPEMFQLGDILRIKLISLLEEKAVGCIQWATLVVEYLSRIGVDTLDAIERELRELSDGPNVLDDTYLALFRRHFDKISAEYANTALRLVAGAARPLSIDELDNAMIVNPLRSTIVSKEDFKKQTQAYRIRILEPFVRISKASSRIVMHNSLRELISRTPHLGNPSGMPYVDNSLSKLALSELLARTCLDFLLLPYFRNVDVRNDFNLDKEEAGNWLMLIQLDSDGNEDELSENEGDQVQERKDGLAFFAYATDYWAQHLSDTDFSQTLIDKSTTLSEAGSMQCHNWWEQYKSAKEQREPRQMSPLLAAIYFGHEPTVRALIQEFRTRNSISHQSNAVSSGQEDFVTYEALSLAVCMENFDIFELLHNAAPDDEIQMNGHWLLLSALERRREDVFKTLVKDPRVVLTHRTTHQVRDRTILTEIARRGNVENLQSVLRLLQTYRREEIMTLLHDKGDEEHCSPLWYAADWGHTEVVEALCSLDLGMIRPQLDCLGKFGVHVVAAAARGGDRRIMVALLKIYPEYVDRLCSGNDTPLAMTRWNSDYKATEVADVLLATGLVNIESTNDFGRTPLMGAFTSGQLDLCKLLIRNGADLSKIIHVSEHDEPACLISTGFPARDIKMRDALLKFSHETKCTIRC